MINRRFPRRDTGAIVLAAVLGAWSPLAVAQDRIFRSGTDTVLLSVTVSAGGNRLVGGLDRDDFQVFEDGRPQTIQVFEREQQPIALSILLDTSTSMENKLHTAQEAAIGFIGRLGPQDLAQVIDFDSRAVMRQTFTADRQALEDAIRATRADGSTSLYNAIAVAVNEQQRADRHGSDEIRRHAIIVLSDGADTSSLYTYEDVLDLTRRAWITIYAIGMRSNAPNDGFREAEFVLRTVSQETGGRAFFIENVADLPGVYQQIADELENQYTIGYTSTNTSSDRAWRQIDVRVARPGTAARTRTGYFAPGPAR